MKTYLTITLGCKVNQFESEAIARQLEDGGLRVAQVGKSPDICIINTCTVTQKASMQARQAIRNAIRRFPEARVIVTGCYAQIDPETIARISGVNEVVGQDQKQAIGPRMVRELKPLDKYPADDSKPTTAGTGNRSDFYLPPKGVTAHRTRPFLKVQDGCDAFCTYCIVPHARGRSRSMPLESVLSGIQKAAQTGVREVVLTGIHLGAWGRDLSPAATLGDLLASIEDTRPLMRVRLSSIEPRELSDDIIDRVAESKVFCTHFHVPLQSGDDGVLKRMRRPYTSRFFRSLLIKIHQALPDAAIGVDALVGFPGESETAFENTYTLIESLPVSYLHVFPFSPRPGTPAAHFKNQIQPAVIKERAKKMRALGADKKSTFFNRNLGRKLPILIEAKRDPSTGLLKGLSANYIPVLVEGDDSLINTLQDVETVVCEGGRAILGRLCRNR